MKKRTLLFLSILILTVCLCFVIFHIRNGSSSALPLSSHQTPYAMAVENLSPKSGVYSEFYFAPNENEELQISVSLRECGTMDGTPREVKILLFQVGMEDNIDSVSTGTFSGSTQLSHTFTGLDPHSHYYLRVDNLSGSTRFSGRFVDGTIEIS